MSDGRLKKLDAALDSVARLVSGSTKIAARLDRLAARRADALSSSDATTFVIVARDQDHQLNNLLVYLKKCSDPGHSFDVVVDPDLREYTKKFNMDGDGAFRILSIKSDQAARRADVYDPAIVNVPLAKRGNIDNQIDKYNKEQKAEQDAKHKAGLQKMRDEKAQAAPLLAEYGERIVAKYKDKFGGDKALRNMLKDMAKSNPDRFLLLVDKFKREGL